MIEMQVEGIGIDGHNNPLVLLRDNDRTRFIPIWIGTSEAMAIQMGLDERAPQRPMTMELITNIMKAMRMHLVQVTINDFANTVFYARLHLRVGEPDAPIQELDVRPSDGIALALRAKCPILVDELVSEKAGVPFESHSDDPQSGVEMERFQRLLEDVDLGESENN
ncbi:MAG: bifunctional nuclease family protein [Abditibacteriaceae bacterium]